MIDDLERQYEQARTVLLKVCAELKACNEGRANLILATLYEVASEDHEIERTLCRGLLDRVIAGRGIPSLVASVALKAIAARAAGDPDWNKCIRGTPETKRKTEHVKKRSRIIQAVEAQIAKGHATSKDGDPGPAFENAAKDLKDLIGNAPAPSTVRDAYYKALKDEDMKLWREIADSLRTPEWRALMGLPPEDS